MYIATEMRQKNDITNTQNAENQHVTQVSSINLINTHTMKTLEELLELMNEVIKRDLITGRKEWFFHYSGHVQKISVAFHYGGWKRDSDPTSRMDTDLKDTNSIQEAYWFIVNRK